MFDKAYTRAARGPRPSAGLLENTMVLAFGEFGRTPKINPAGGPRPLAAVLDHPLRRRPGPGRPGRRRLRRDRRLPQGSPGQRRPRSPRPSSRRSASTSSTSSRARRADRSRSSITAFKPSRSCSEAAMKPISTLLKLGATGGALALAGLLLPAGVTSMGVVALDTPRPAAEVAAPAGGWSFRNHVMPVLTKAGCNSGACHGAAAGKNGFKLTLRGYDPEVDYATLTRQAARPPRQPARAGAEPDPAQADDGHRRTAAGSASSADSLEYRSSPSGSPPGCAGPPRTTRRSARLEVGPRPRRWPPGPTQQLLVHAHYTDGHVEDVTRWVKFATGRRRRSRRWTRTAASRCRGTARPRSPSGTRAGCLRARRRRRIPNEIRRRGLRAAPPRRTSSTTWCSRSWRALQHRAVRTAAADARVHPPRLSSTRPASCPTARGGRAFRRGLRRRTSGRGWSTRCSSARSSSTTGRTSGPTSCWSPARKLAAERHVGLLQLDPRSASRRTSRGTGSRARSSRASGSTRRERRGQLLRPPQGPDRPDRERHRRRSSACRITCARCHNHPLEKWTQKQYYEMANLFARVGLKKRRAGRRHPGLLERRRGLNLVRLIPRTRQAAPAAAARRRGRCALDSSQRPPRAPRAWLTSPTTATSRGRSSTASGATSLGAAWSSRWTTCARPTRLRTRSCSTALTKDFVDHGFDVKHLIRTIMNSAAYQRSAARQRDEPAGRSLLLALPHPPAAGRGDARRDLAGDRRAEPVPGYPAGTRATAAPRLARDLVLPHRSSASRRGRSPARASAADRASVRRRCTPSTARRSTRSS